MNEQERATEFIKKLKELETEYGMYVVAAIDHSIVAEDYLTENRYEIEYDK